MFLFYEILRVLRHEKLHRARELLEKIKISDFANWPTFLGVDRYIFSGGPMFVQAFLLSQLNLKVK